MLDIVNMEDARRIQASGHGNIQTGGCGIGIYRAKHMNSLFLEKDKFLY
jgi:hypothetical protein